MYYEKNTRLIIFINVEVVATTFFANITCIVIYLFLIKVREHLGSLHSMDPFFNYNIVHVSRMLI